MLFPAPKNIRHCPPVYVQEPCCYNGLSNGDEAYYSNSPTYWPNLTLTECIRNCLVSIYHNDSNTGHMIFSWEPAQ